MNVDLRLGDCLEVMRGMDAGSVSAVVTDPPYGLSFMGKDWDHGVPGAPFWEAALRVAKPGAMLLAFGGTRTHHRLMCAIEDAGWEIRDCLMWLYGSGFPKSMDIGKAIDKAAGAEREVVSKDFHRRLSSVGGIMNTVDKPRYTTVDIPSTDAAREWNGWGTALKPAWEPIIMARKPLDGTVAANVLAHGTGGINVDACRIGETGARNNGRQRGTNGIYGEIGATQPVDYGKGRWPANLMLDEEAAAMLDEISGERKSGAWNGHRNTPKTREIFGAFASADEAGKPASDGGASRFFYVAKASKRDRDEGLEVMEERAGALRANGRFHSGGRTQVDGEWMETGSEPLPKRNGHPCVKPTQLMRYLCRMVTPPNGTVLDPFCGSGSTGKAAVMEGFSFIGIDTEDEYLAIATKRIAEAQLQLPLLLTEPTP